MNRCIACLVVVAALCGATVEAQTITGRIDPVWDEETEQYTYGFGDNSLQWAVEVAPSSARSDELSVYLYYNKRSAWMGMTLWCRENSRADWEVHAYSVSGEHFLSLTTGLITGEQCVLALYGGNSRDEVVSYRMAVSERLARSTVQLE